MVLPTDALFGDPLAWILRFAACWPLSLLLAIPLARADEAVAGRFYGMVRSRDLTPLGFLRLDMRPAHAMS